MKEIIRSITRVSCCYPVVSASQFPRQDKGGIANNAQHTSCPHEKDEDQLQAQMAAVEADATHQVMEAAADHLRASLSRANTSTSR